MPSIYEEDWDDTRQLFIRSRKCNLPLGHDAPHHPNKSEAAMLRKLMQAAGATEEEVRASKTNRRRLAEAAKEPSRQGTTDRQALRLKRRRRQDAKRLGVEVWQLDEIAKLRG